MTRLRGRTVLLVVPLLLCFTAGLAPAEEWEKVLIPARPDMPLANPITTTEIPPPPLSLLKDRPVNPACICWIDAGTRRTRDSIFNAGRNGGLCIRQP